MPTVTVPTVVPAHESAVPVMVAAEAVEDDVPAGQ